MIVGTRYNMSLLATVSGKASIVAAKLIGVTDNSAAGVSAVIAEHNSTKYKLPDTLKAIDIYSQLFYHFREDGKDYVLVIPEAYINQSTVTEVSQLTKTIVVSLASAESYAQLVNVLNDNGFQYRVV